MGASISLLRDNDKVRGMTQATEQLQHRLSVLERKVDFLLKALNLHYREPIEPYLNPVVELLSEGKREAALLKYMELHSCSNPEARAALTSLEARLKQG